MTFTERFGDTPRNRLLDFLGDHPASDYSITEMAEKAEISRPTIYRLLPELERTGLIVQTRTLGQSRLFKLNTEDEAVKGVLAADMEQSRRKAAVEAGEVAEAETVEKG